MTRSVWGFGLIALIGGLFAAGLSPAQAQTALCPGAVGGQAGIALANGTCTNGVTGAFSGAALATQALSDLSQSATQETVRNTTSALQSRREQEQQRCPDGFSRVDGQCVRNTPVAAPPRPVLRPAPARVVTRRVRPTVAAVTRRRVAPRAIVEAPPPPPPTLVAYPAPIYQSRYGTWALGFGNTEDRSAVGSTTINCCTGPVAGGIPNILTISEKSSSNTFGFLGGFDYTSRSLFRPDDGLIFGVLAGYIGSDIRIKTSTVSNSPGNVGNGSGIVRANLSGGSAGFYATYFNGPLTADLTFKADIYDLRERFSDQLAFTVNVIGGALIAPGVVPFNGAGSGGLTNLSTFGNLSYRMFTLGPVWIEPTVGFQYTDSLYDGRARRQLGLDDGDLLMFQGGARFGTDTFMADRSRLTTSVTGLVYDDVMVNGGAIGNGQFANNLLAKADEGKVRGRGILAVNYAMVTGVSLFAQGEVYGGDRLFGAGGKGGVRVEW